MRALGIALLLVVVLACTDCRRLQSRWGRQNIPERCLALSVTPVSCELPAPDSLMAHPDDCQLFYYCVWAGAAAVCRQCPAGLHFNPRLRVCDHPAAAGCRSTPSSTPTPTPTTTTTTPNAPAISSTTNTTSPSSTPIVSEPIVEMSRM